MDSLRHAYDVNVVKPHLFICAFSLFQGALEFWRFGKVTGFASCVLMCTGYFKCLWRGVVCCFCFALVHPFLWWTWWVRYRMKSNNKNFCDINSDRFYGSLTLKTYCKCLSVLGRQEMWATLNRPWVNPFLKHHLFQPEITSIPTASSDVKEVGLIIWQQGTTRCQNSEVSTLLHLVDF